MERMIGNASTEKIIESVWRSLKANVSKKKQKKNDLLILDEYSKLRVRKKIFAVLNESY